MTGPSFTSETRMSVRNRPRRHRRAELAEALDHRIDQRLGVLGPGSGDPARPPPRRRVAVERELAHDEQLAGRVRDGAVHHAGIVVDHPQVPQLVGELPRRPPACRCASRRPARTARHRSRRRARARPRARRAPWPARPVAPARARPSIVPHRHRAAAPALEAGRSAGCPQGGSGRIQRSDWYGMSTLRSTFGDSATLRPR